MRKRDPNQPTLRERQAQERRRQIIDAALGVYAEKGLAGATTKDLARAAGVAEGLIYHYFRSKEELLFAVVDEHSFLPDLRRILSGAAHERPAADVLSEIAVGFSALLERHDLLVRLFFREAQTRPEVAAHLGQMIGEAVALLTQYMAARVDAGELRPHDTSITARSLLFAIFMSHLTRSHSEPFLAGLVHSTLHGILAR